VVDKRILDDGLSVPEFLSALVVERDDCDLFRFSGCCLGG